jgi:ABC-2 type transport system permease protein
LSDTATLAWFARHEVRLAWRETLSMLTAGKPRRLKVIALAFVFFGIAMHAVAFSIVGRFADVEAGQDRGTLLVVTGCALLSWSLMMSQAMESVTRVFYARSDLDLILSSPAPSRRAFAVRIGTMAGGTILMALLVASPFINVLIWRGGVRWLAAYGAVIAIGAVAAALAVGLAVALFRTIGPQRTRLVAQIVAAVIGAFFVIGLQVAAITSYGTMFNLSFLQSETVTAMVPAADSALWWPARAILGDLAALAALLTAGVVLLGASIAIFASRFGADSIAAAGVSRGRSHRQARARPFRRRSPKAALRHKEWALLARDPWLLSQTLMQLLYLLPPALMLWTAFGKGSEDLVLLVPVLVMAAGQLAGGLAWLAISGEDAPDLVATAPVPARFVTQAKVEAVLVSVATIFAPFCLVMALASPRDALFSALGSLAAALSATLIQLWFRNQAPRRHFRRRQTSSRIATFAEAFSSIAWAATAGLASAGHWQAGFVVVLALGLLVAVRAVAPARA